VAVVFLVLRRKRPDLERPFSCPGVPHVAILAVLTSFYLAEPADRDVDTVRYLDGHRARHLLPVRREAQSAGPLTALPTSASVSVMRFVMDIDLDALKDKPEVEIARILRYWAGALSQMGLAVGTDQVLMDSAYTPVGHLRVTE